VFYIRNGRYGVEGFDGCIGDTLAQDNFRQWIERNALRDDAPGVRAYPSGTGIGWTVKEFGPFLIPQKGCVIVMNHRNVFLYGSAIERETGGRLTRNDDGTVSLGDSVITEYRFLYNYYFMTGDKVENSRDSRYWGLVPEDFIVGRVCRILRSVDKYTGETRWERFLKKVE
jgi:signal peptidase I